MNTRRTIAAAAIAALATIPTGCSLVAPYLPTTPPTTLPPCPTVTYDGDLGTPPVWDTPDGQPPTYDCAGTGTAVAP